MNFKPKSKEELETMTILQPGIYRFKVNAAKDKVSRNGNEMIELTLQVEDREGNNTLVFDYLLEAMMYKLFSFCEATGMEGKYHNGTLTAQDCIGKSAGVELTLRKGEPNPSGGMYADKNEVKKYIARGGSAQAEEEDFDDSIPF